MPAGDRGLTPNRLEFFYVRATRFSFSPTKPAHTHIHCFPGRANKYTCIRACTCVGTAVRYVRENSETCVCDCTRPIFLSTAAAATTSAVRRRTRKGGHKSIPGRPFGGVVRVVVVVRLYLYKTARRENRIRTDPRGRCGDDEDVVGGDGQGLDRARSVYACMYMHDGSKTKQCRALPKIVKIPPKLFATTLSLVFTYVRIYPYARAHIENASCVL